MLNATEDTLTTQEKAYRYDCLIEAARDGITVTIRYCDYAPDNVELHFERKDNA